ncbi:type II toxin-antitoxin system RelE family toxin [Streptomyces sp. NPDC001393]
MLYQIEFTERAAAQRDALPEERRKLLERGLLKLAEDPFTPVSQAVSGEDIRVVSVAPGLTVDYMVHRAFLILVSVALLEQSLIEAEDV